MKRLWRWSLEWNSCGVPFLTRPLHLVHILGCFFFFLRERERERCMWGHWSESLAVFRLRLCCGISVSPAAKSPARKQRLIRRMMRNLLWCVCVVDQWGGQHVKRAPLPARPPLSKLPPLWTTGHWSKGRAAAQSSACSIATPSCLSKRTVLSLINGSSWRIPNSIHIFSKCSFPLRESECISMCPDWTTHIWLPHAFPKSSAWTLKGLILSALIKLLSKGSNWCRNWIMMGGRWGTVLWTRLTEKPSKYRQCCYRRCNNAAHSKQPSLALPALHSEWSRRIIRRCWCLTSSFVPLCQLSEAWIQWEVAESLAAPPPSAPSFVPGASARREESWTPVNKSAVSHPPPQ